MKRPLKVLVACEESQAVCLAFRKRGHEAYSCDLQACSGGHPEWHIMQDVTRVIIGGVFYTESANRIKIDSWDLMVGHPPCTYLSYAATSSWDNEGRLKKRLEALKFFADLWRAPIEKICLENPSGCASPTIAKYSQSIQPYYFGDPESKRTWLWLKNLPKLLHIEEGTLFGESTHTKPKIYGYYKNGKKTGQPIYGNNYLQFSEDRGKIRSKTFPGIARAMAEQWSEDLGNTWNL